MQLARQGLLEGRFVISVVGLVRCGAARRLLPADPGTAGGEAGAGRADQGVDRRGDVFRLSQGCEPTVDEQPQGVSNLPVACDGRDRWLEHHS